MIHWAIGLFRQGDLLIAAMKFDDENLVGDSLIGMWEGKGICLLVYLSLFAADVHKFSECCFEGYASQIVDIYAMLTLQHSASDSTTIPIPHFDLIHALDLQFRCV